MYAGRNFPEFEDGATRILGFDLSRTLQSGETISSVKSALTCIDGTDVPLSLSPTARFVGSPAFSGSRVTQGIVFNDAPGSLIGNTYTLIFYVTTSLGQVIAPWARFALGQGYGYPALPPVAPSSTGQIIVLPIGVPKILLSSLGNYAEQDYPVADQGETWLYGFDLSPALSPGELITTVTFALSRQSGTDVAVDNSSTARFSGPALISGNAAQRLTVWPLPAPTLGGNIYVLNAIALTSFSQSISTWARITISAGM